MRRLLATLLAVASPLAGAAPAAAFGEADLQAKLSREMRLAGPATGAYVRDLDSGEELFALRENVARIPASVEKLYTTSSAMLRLGPSATIDTTVVTDALAPVDALGVLHGDLVLVGAGDPFFGDASAAALARAMRATGIVAVDGAVVGDETRFDALRSNLSTRYDFELGGVLSALAYDRGIFRGKARTDAARFAAARFAARLKAAGVSVSGPSRAGAAPLGARAIAAVPSRPVGELARFVNVPSNNFAAEMLLKLLGARFRDEGSTAAGADVARDTLDDFGVRPRIIDGSGLSRSDRTTPRQVVRLLERMHGQDVAASFRASLAVPGSTGTVRRRMRGTPARRCRVKTGTLRDVSSLAGYCTTLDGREVGFALLLNRVYTPAAKNIEDRIAASIARLDEDAPAVPDAGGTAPRP
ncbi:MAG TPA: D-alanyl-D-alanine carboxypeptidase/D-alanyl-D-alanine-endopeptidase [Solirubrobacteraceae bacterium]|nr:D-alanyl-D-alanine carboxypeptidase/D-alanyl-D-alanine-endopeptidase [Solirubrobacteraceae bacterium]